MTTEPNLNDARAAAVLAAIQQRDMAGAHTPAEAEEYWGPASPRRLSPAEANDAMWAFVDHRYPDGDFPEDFAAGLTIQYRDDLDADTSEYQVVDGRGCGDGSGLWTPIK